MPFIFVKWAIAHALNLMGPIASYIKAHNLSGTPSLFRFLTILISHVAEPKILFFCHPMDCFNTGSDVLAATHVDCTLAGCSPSHEAVCSASTRRANDDLQPKNNGVSNGAWTALRWWLRCALNGAWTTPSNSAWTTLVIAPKNGTSTRLNGAGMALVAAPKMAAEQRQVWGLKRI